MGKKILFATDAFTPQVNGAAMTGANMVEQLENLGHDVQVLHPRSTRYFPYPPDRSQKPEYDIAVPLLKPLPEIKTPDSVHIHTEGPVGLWTLMACWWNKWSYTTSYCTNFADYAEAHAPGPLKPLARRVVDSLTMAFHNASAGVFVPTEELGRELKSRGLKRNFHVVGRPVDTGRFRPLAEGEKNYFRDDLGHEGPFYLYVGRVTKEKNLRDFLSIRTDGIKVIVGDGDDRAALEKEYQDDNVLFLGTKEGAELARIFRSADMFVFPSRTDTFGRVLIEAVASGTPIVTYPKAAGPDLVRHGPLCGATAADFTFESFERAFRKADAMRIERLPHKELDAQVRHKFAENNYSPAGFGKLCEEGLVPVDYHKKTRNSPVHSPQAA